MKKRLTILLGLIAVIAVVLLALWLHATPRKTIHPRVLSQLNKIDNEITAYRVVHGTFPEDLQSLTQLPDDCLKDPWENAFHYKKTGESYELRSLGPDGRLGTDDDWK